MFRRKSRPSCGRLSLVPDGSGYTPSMMKHGRYTNPWADKSRPSYRQAMKFFFFDKDDSQVPHNKEVLDRELPVVPVDHALVSRPPNTGVRATWIGHATVLTQFDGITVLTDPIFSDRCGPKQVNGFVGSKRFRPPPCTVDELPQTDAVCISHNHYDHLDTATIEALNRRFGDRLCWFVPMGLKEWMNDAGCNNVLEMDWWQENAHPDLPEVKFAFTPAQHWCKRGIRDDNLVLWGSWSVIGPKHRFFFAGDTGYCPGFKQIGRKYGPFDLAAIPIGAYEPRAFMSFQHVNPEEAVDIHCDVKAKKSLGIHWGTFKLANEFYLEPPQKVKEAMRNMNLVEDDFFVLKHGESRLVGEIFESAL